MKNRRNIKGNLFVLVTLILANAFQMGARDFTKYVDTRMGTASRFEFSRGNTYPGCGRPFGEHLWSAQTGRDGDGWKYVYMHKEMRGFTLSHQCSPWPNDYCRLTLFPQMGKLRLSSMSRGEKFKHCDEVAQPHTYSVRFKNGIFTEVAPTERCCQLRFSFPSKDEARIIVDLQNQHGEVFAEPGNCRLRGYVDRLCAKWPKEGESASDGRDTLRNFFVIELDKPFEEAVEWQEDGEHGLYLSYEEGARVCAKVGCSYLGWEQAALNLEREIGKKSIEKTRREGQKEWNELLRRIDVSGGTEEDYKTFYTCLYHANLNSRKFYEYDKDGNPVYFSPYDFRKHEGFMYTDNGFWDSFRSQFPLNNLLHPTMQSRYMQAILDVYDQLGWLPSWSCPDEQGGMIGNHAVSLLVDAMAKGIGDFDVTHALEAYVHEVTHKGPKGPSNGREGLEEYWRLGYVPYPDHNYSSSMTLEYAYDDFCGYLLAQKCGNEEWKEKFGASMYNYRNVFCPEVGFMRGKDSKGNWTEGFRPGAWGGPFIEGDAWHWNWSVNHDVQGLINLYGSDKAFVAALDAVFAERPIIDFGFYGEVYNEMVEMVVADLGQYEHGNQPIQHMAYMYSYAGEPWKTQHWVRQIMKKLYHCNPEGYPGDEDQGAMSAWYVLSALGLYCVTPGIPEYVVGSPLFQKAVVTLENGRKFTILADENNEDNEYIQQAHLNEQPLERNYLLHDEIMKGGTLHLQMGEDPNTQRCTGKDASPFSLSKP